MLFVTADHLTRGGETGIFTPMHMILCRKPEMASSPVLRNGDGWECSLMPQLLWLSSKSECPCFFNFLSLDILSDLRCEQWWQFTEYMMMRHVRSIFVVLYPLEVKALAFVEKMRRQRARGKCMNCHEPDFFPTDCNQQEFSIAWAITLELIWKIQNDLIHDKEPPSPEATAKMILNSTAKHLNARATRKAPVLENCEWSAPPPDWFKVNSNIALKDDKCFAAFISLLITRVSSSWLKQQKSSLVIHHHLQIGLTGTSIGEGHL
ncbi:24-methylenesterol C-methyltransferase 3 [Sesamum angolense]|uniref:24-methylenesterol C-methyltransferase 3 n=1 Tax=Sesamum angolense TaxID=2727404 RepID=A0AAE2BXQ7_9LAMI|nr:24-methylenesterol C-methyltransferase 3 [Sesamum angolense]